MNCHSGTHLSAVDTSCVLCAWRYEVAAAKAGSEGVPVRPGPGPRLPVGWGNGENKPFIRFVILLASHRHRHPSRHRKHPQPRRPKFPGEYLVEVAAVNRSGQEEEEELSHFCLLYPANDVLCLDVL